MHIAKKRRAEEEPMELDESPGCSNAQNGQALNEDTESDKSDDEEGGMRVGDIYIPPAPKPALTFDTTGPRLIITHIVNENFKSYAGVQILGPFHKSFTSIIGPNGSGKSNVIDSMLFVFGYRATKIRSKKISVLIHSSSKFPHISNATVAVHFCQIIDGEGEDFTIVPNSEIVVARTAFKDNSSTYTLNGRRVQFKEVARMLRSHGIDLDHNRFLILQGEVEQIAMMKSKAQSEHETGMLEYLEDIIGTSRYWEPLAKTESKAKEYGEMRIEKLNRLDIVDQEKKALEGPMKEAVELINLTNVVIKTRNMLLQKYIHETNKIIENKTRELNELKETMAKIDEKMSKIQEELLNKTTELKNGTKKYDELQKKKDAIAEKLQQCKRKTVTVQADYSQMNKKKKNLDQLIEQERGKRIDLELVPDKNKREIEDCEKLLEKHKENKLKAEQELETVMAGVRSKTQDLQEKKDRLQAKLIDLKKTVDEANNEYKLAESELKIYMSTEQNEVDKYEKFKEAYQKAKNDLDEKKSLRQELSITIPVQEKQITETQAKLHAIMSEEATISREARSLRAQLEESHQAMSMNKSRNRVLDALMQEKNSGRLPGIFGRLGDLGGIDAKYDIAISTCCPQLDNIVVDTVETAQACVEFLKRGDIGRATFIVLDKQTHLINTYQNRQNYPENVPRIFDLIRVNDECLLPAFYFVLRDTLVANDLDQASRIAYGATRYRVVSLQGQLIEVSGTMSGGGSTPSRGKMSSSAPAPRDADPASLRRDEARLAEKEARLIEIRSEQTNLEELLLSLQRSVYEGKTTLHKLDIELKSLVEQVPTLKAQIKQQERKVTKSRVDARQKAKLEQNLREAEEKLESAKFDAGEIEKLVQGVDDQISAVAGNKVKDLQKNVDELTKKIDKISSEITKLRVAINTSIRNAKKTKDKINQMEADLSETERNLENLNNQKKQLSLENGQLQKDFDELEEQINEGTTEFSGLRQEIARLQAKENKVKAERLEVTNAVQKMEKSVHDCTTKVPLWEQELSTLKLEDPGINDIPGLEPLTPLVRHSAEELEACEVEELRNRLTVQKTRVGDNKPNVLAIQEYKAKADLYVKRTGELEEITAKRNEMKQLYLKIRGRRQKEFENGYLEINGKLKEMYQMITLGGDAELELVDSLDAFLDGVSFTVRPPNKSWKFICNLSGGEKTLASLALVFALHYYKPTPLYVMDEIDAALDFKNVSIVANYIKERTRNAQFIIISLRYNMFEASNRLVGIYKTEDCTKSVTIENLLPEPPIEDVVGLKY